MGEATPVADLPSLQEDKNRARYEVVRNGSAIWERIRLRVEARLHVIEVHAHRLLDRDLTNDEIAEAISSAGALASELGRLELPSIARLARHLSVIFEGDALSAGDAVHIASTTDDIRTLLESAVAQHDAAENSRGSVVAIGEASTAFDAICWVLATRGHRIVHDGNKLPQVPDEPSGVLVSLTGAFTDATASLLRAVDETWTVPVVALYDEADHDLPLHKATEYCDVLLPISSTADDIDTELLRAGVAQTRRLSLIAHGRVPRATSELLRAYGFRIRRASTLDVMIRLLSEEPAVVLFGVTARTDDLVAAAQVMRAIPATRRTPIFWLGADHHDQHDLAHRHGVWPVDAITDGLALRMAALLRAELAERAEDDQDAGALLPWPAARVLTDRSLVAAHRNGSSVAVTVIAVGPEVAEAAIDRLRRTLSSEFRRGDIIGQRDNRCVVVALQGVTRQVATNRFSELLERLDLDDGSAEAGIAMFPSDGRSADELVQAAEAASSMARLNQGPAVVSTAWRPTDEQAADILVVEADAVLGQMLSSVIETRGLRAELIDNGTAALDRLTNSEKPMPRLLLLDMDVAGLDGLSLVRRLRRAGVMAQLNVLLMTARSSESDLRVALDLGVSEVIRKPFSSSLLLHRLMRLLED